MATVLSFIEARRNGLLARARHRVAGFQSLGPIDRVTWHKSALAARPEPISRLTRIVWRPARYRDQLRARLSRGGLYNPLHLVAWADASKVALSAGRADFRIPFDSFRPENALVVPGHGGNVSAVSHGLLRLMRGCRERRNPNFSIELGDEVV